MMILLYRYNESHSFHRYSTFIFLFQLLLIQIIIIEFCYALLSSPSAPKTKSKPGGGSLIIRANQEDDEETKGPSFITKKEQCEQHQRREKQQKSHDNIISRRDAVVAAIMSTTTTPAAAIAVMKGTTNNDNHPINKTKKNILDSSSSFLSSSSSSSFSYDNNLQNFKYTNEWIGTSLQLLSPYQAVTKYYCYDTAKEEEKETSLGFPFAKWPDPILRHKANKIPKDFPQSKLHQLANLLRNTARKNKAVGLAAQQCGINASMIFLETNTPKKTARKTTTKTTNSQFSSSTAQSSSSSTTTAAASAALNNNDNDGIFLINPEIIDRSSEIDMKVWNEECLVLPPTFRATVLRDDTITIRYEDIQQHGDGSKISYLTLQGELARAAQHEMDHDHGILILDHITFDEMENDVMRRIERDGHQQRQQYAYRR